MQTEQLLIQKISSRPSTEELIFFIAQDDAITSACADLYKKITGSNQKELKRINLLCQRYRISLPDLKRELDHVQGIFAPRKALSTDHKILGLQAGASLAEVKQAYRRLSIQYHPDTSGKKDTEKFITITKAYQRLINTPDKEESTSHASTSTWRYGQKKTSKPKRKKRYLYLFSFIAVALLLIIVGISIHYQQRAMLSNISMKDPVSLPQTSSAKKEQAAPVQQAPDSLLTKKVTPKKEQEASLKEPVSFTAKKITPALPDHASLTISSQKKFSQGEMVPAVAPETTDFALLPVGAGLQTSASNTGPQTEPHIRQTTQPESPLPDLSNEQEVMTREVNSLPQPTASIDASNAVEDIVGETGEEQEGGTGATQEENNIFSDMLPTEDSVPKEKGLLTSETTQPAVQKKDNSLFSGKYYQKAIIVKANSKKKKVKKSPAKKIETPSKGVSTLESLRAFIKSYSAAYRSRSIQQFALFFAKGAQENGVPFSTVIHQYKKIFTATQSVDYRIDLLGTEVQEQGATAILTGRFHVQLVYTPQKITSNSGTITFFLVRKKESYKITALTYQLDPKRQ
jgi:DnaJ-domain-containing protein 1